MNLVLMVVGPVGIGELVVSCHGHVLRLFLERESRICGCDCAIVEVGLVYFVV